MTDNEKIEHTTTVSEHVKALLDDRTRLLETVAQVAQALGWNVGRVQLGDGDVEYHLPCAADMVEAINNLTFKEVRCSAAPGTTDCLVSTPADTAAEDGWRTVTKGWWCSACLRRYGFEIDAEQPETHAKQE